MSDTKAASVNNNHGHSSGTLMRRPRFHACQPVRTTSNTINRVRIEAVCASGNTHRYSAKSASTGGGMPISAGLAPSSGVRANDLAHGWQIGRPPRAPSGHVFEQLDGEGEGAVGLGAVGK